MALHIAHPDTEEQTLELIGIRLDRPPMPRYRELLAEVEHLRELVAAKDTHIASLETQVWAWRSQTSNEQRAHRNTTAAAWERECELIRVIHQQAIALQTLQERQESEQASRRWWTRGA